MYTGCHYSLVFNLSQIFPRPLCHLSIHLKYSLEDIFQPLKVVNIHEL
jgi:hypothetical protein